MTSLYIHIPFCKKKCNYCDFVSYAGKENLIDQYVDALASEIRHPLTTHYLQLSTIYFGGGTPTLLEPKHFAKILDLLTTNNSLLSTIEVSVESNPGTADKTKLKELRKLGINRLSIGAQSFNDKHLKTLGRIHNSEDIFRFYRDARSAGFNNINLDLIFALPNQTLDEWKEDIRTAIDLQSNHLSTYNLQIEEGTPLHSLLSTNNLLLTDENTELAMYEHAIETLNSNGYKHYEISNFAKPGFECKHNINYWRNGNYLGVGAGAHSHVNGRRWANSGSIEEYLASRSREFHSQVPSKSEAVFLGLRLMHGLEIDKFLGFEKELAELTASGFLMRENSHVKLTRKGLYLANEVFEKFV